MKLVAIKSNLKEAVSSVEKITGENPNLPILKNILIETADNKIKITSTNLEIAITKITQGKVIENGKITIPAGTFSGVINNLQTERINLESEGSKLKINTDTYEAVIQGNSADDFPITPKVKNQSKYIEISAGVLKAALGQVLVAAQFSDLRPELNSVFFDFQADEIKLVATDSFRLAEKKIFKDQFNANQEEAFSMLIPLKTAHEVLRVFKDEDVIKIHSDENQVLFKTEQLELLSRLVEGSFPDYEAIIPKGFSAELNIGRQEFLSALKLIAVFGSKSNEVKLQLKSNKKVIELSSADHQLGESRYVLPVKIEGKLEEITFNWRYLADSLKAVNSESIFFGVNGENEPSEIKPAGDNSYIYILKPIAAT